MPVPSQSRRLPPASSEQQIISDVEVHHLLAELYDAVLTALARDEGEADPDLARVLGHLAAARHSSAKARALMLAAGYQMPATH